MLAVAVDCQPGNFPPLWVPIGDFRHAESSSTFHSVSPYFLGTFQMLKLHLSFHQAKVELSSP